MNHGNNNGGNFGSNNNHRNNGCSRANRNRYPARQFRNDRTVTAQHQQQQQQQQQQQHRLAMDSQVSTSLVNGIKQGLWAVKNADSISPIDSPTQGQSPVHQIRNINPQDPAALWHMDVCWGKKKIDSSPYPIVIPTMNGASAYAGGPLASSASPVGSSRGSPYSNASPTPAVSGCSSPSRLPNYYPMNASNGRRCSAEDNFYKLRTLSPDALFNLQDINRVDSRLSDETNYAYYPTCKSSESRSSEDLSIENIMGEFCSRTPDTASDAKRNSASSGSASKCTECTLEKLCDNCSTEACQNGMMLKAVDRAESAQDEHLMKELSSAMTALELMPFTSTQTMPVSNQLALPKQIVAQQNHQPLAQFSIPGQLAVLAQVDDKTPLASSSPLMFHNQRTLPEQPILYCSVHNAAQRFYCQTCSNLFCNECGPEHHVGHLTMHLLDAIEASQKQAQRVITECHYGVAVINDDLERGMEIAQTLDAKAREAASIVRTATRQLREALHNREQELLDSIEAAYQNKQTALQTREKGLKVGASFLIQTIDKLSRSLENSSLTSNPLDLIVAKDTASAQIHHVKSMRNSLPLADDQFASIQMPDQRMVESVRNLGNITFSNGTIGDRRLLARANIANMSPPTTYPRARAVAGAKYKVSIVSNRHLVNGSPYAALGKSFAILGNDPSNLDENLCRPWGVACDREGHIVVADRSNNRIQIFLMNGQFVRRFGSHGTSSGQFDRPAGVAVDARRRIVVSDKDNHRIQVFTMEGEFLLCFGEKGSTPGQFNYPWDVATNDACQIVVSDTRNHRIQLFSAEGVFLRKFGFEAQPQLWKCLDSPRGVAFLHDGSVVVTDFNNHRVIVVDSDFIAGRFLGSDSLAVQPMPAKTLLRPQGIAVDDNGHILVCDSRHHCVQILDHNGGLVWRFGESGSKPGQMDRPSGIAVAPDGKIVIVDFGNNRVNVY